MDAYSLGVAQIELLASQNSQFASCGLATGFFYRRGDALNLITNWHVVGSPAIARHSGILKVGTGPALGPNDIIGTVTKFMGIYSGRIGEDSMGVQLGLVWKTDVLDDILSAKTRGMNPFRQRRRIAHAVVGGHVNIARPTSVQEWE